MGFKNVKEALESIKNDAAKDAWIYLIREKAETADAIQYLVDNKWDSKRIMDEVRYVYGPTEEKTIHKIELVVNALVAGKVLE